MSDALTQLAIDFSLLSLITVGGVITVLPDAPQRRQVHGWMSGAEFAQLFALAQAAPGPIFIPGRQPDRLEGVGPLRGAAVATAAVCAPSSTF